MRVAVLLLTVALVAPAHAARRTVAAVGDASALGLPLSRISDVALDDRGRVAFIAASTGIFRHTDTGILRLLAAGDGLFGKVVAGVGTPDYGPDACVAFRTIFVGGESAIVRNCGGAFESVAEAPGTAPKGEAMLGFGPDVRVGSGGRVAFTAILSSGPTAVLLRDGGALVEITRTGGTSPAGGTFVAFRLAGVSAAGHVGFRGSVTGGRDGLFFSSATGLTKLVVDGDASPVGGSFGAIGFATLNDADLWAFRANLTPGSGAGVFRGDTSMGLPLLSGGVLQGQDTPIGGTFRDLPNSIVPSINAHGDIAFRVTLQDALFPSGVFVVAVDGTVRKIAATGEPTAAGQLLRFRELELADDGSVLLRANVAGGTPGLFRARGGRVEGFALLGDTTDIGGGFRFTDPSAAGAVESGVFLGAREGVFVVESGGTAAPVATLGDRTPLGGTYAGFEPPAAGGQRLAFGASIRGGHTGEALFAVDRRGPRPVVAVGNRIGPHCRIVDLFQSTLDDLGRAGVGPGGVAFAAGLSGCGAATGLFARGASGAAVVLAGKRAPGGVYRAFGTPTVVGVGRIGFVAQVGTASETAIVLRQGKRARAVARFGDDTGTRLGGKFRAFDPPAAIPGGLVFRATLDQGIREGIFVARKHQLSALVGTADGEPGGGHYRSFSGPTGAGSTVVFHADVTGTAVTSGIYRAPYDGLGAEPPPVTSVARAGDASPLGGSFLSFAPPAGNRTGAVAIAADLAAATSTTIIFVDDAQ